MAALYPEADCNCKRRRASRSFEFEERRLVGGRGFDNQQAEVHRLGDQVRAVAGIEFEAHILDMSLDGARRDMDLERDLLGRAADGYQFHVMAPIRPAKMIAGKMAAEIWRSEEHTFELQSLMRISYAVFCLKKK